MQGTKRALAILGLAGLWALSGCGGGAQTAAPASSTSTFDAWVAQQHTAPASSAPGAAANGLPAFPVESGLRSASADGGSQTVLGQDFIIDKNSAVDGTSLVIGPSAGGNDSRAISYGLYKFTGLTGQQLSTLKVSAQPADLDMGYYVALADFTHLKWQWLGPTTLPEFEFDFTQQNNQYISPLGNVYVVVATHGGDVTTHNYSILTYGANGGGGTDPGAPTGLVASDGDISNGVGVTWQPGEGAQWYEIYRADNDGNSDPSGGGWVLLDKSPAPKYFDASAAPGVVYYYKARSAAADSAGTLHYSSFSNVDSGYAGQSAPGGAPLPPKGLVASDGDLAAQIAIKWMPGDGDQWFELYRNMENSEGPGWTLVATTKDPYFVDAGVTPGLVYDYEARGAAYAADGSVVYSDYSNIDSGYASDSSGGGGNGGDPNKP